MAEVVEPGQLRLGDLPRERLGDGDDGDRIAAAPEHVRGDVEAGQRSDPPVPEAVSLLDVRSELRERVLAAPHCDRLPGRVELRVAHRLRVPEDPPELALEDRPATERGEHGAD